MSYQYNRLLHQGYDQRVWPSTPRTDISVAADTGTRQLVWRRTHWLAIKGNRVRHGGHTWRCTTASHMLLNLKPGLRDQPQMSSVHGFTLGTSRVRKPGTLAQVAGLSPRWPGSIHVGFVVDKAALGQVFLRILRFFPSQSLSKPISSGECVIC
jgi:hypothetical protein